MGRVAEVVAPSSSIRTDGGCPVVQINDLSRSLARIMHHAALFCTSGELTRADVPSGGIGVRQLGMQRVRG